MAYLLILMVFFISCYLVTLKNNESHYLKLHALQLWSSMLCCCENWQTLTQSSNVYAKIKRCHPIQSTKMMTVIDFKYKLIFWLDFVSCTFAKPYKPQETDQLIHFYWSFYITDLVTLLYNESHYLKLHAL